MAFKMRWLGTAGFELVLAGGSHVLIDPHLDNSVTSPIMSDGIEKCDFLFLTHGHWDHVLDVGTMARRFGPPIYCNRDTAKALAEHQKVDASLINTLTRGDSVSLGGFKVEVLGGIHASLAKEYKRISGKDLPGEDQFETPLERAKAITLATSGTDEIHEEHLKWRTMYPGGEQLNFVFELDDGQRIYMAGSYPDPFVKEEAKKAEADITLMQCMSSNKLKGLEKDTAEVIYASGCKTAVPQHHDPLYHGGRQTDLSILRGMVEKRGIDFMEMEPGRWYRFEKGRPAETA